jgi:hypothetical protein
MGSRGVHRTSNAWTSADEGRNEQQDRGQPEEAPDQHSAFLAHLRLALLASACPTNVARRQRKGNTGAAELKETTQWRFGGARSSAAGCRHGRGLGTSDSTALTEAQDREARRSEVVSAVYVSCVIGYVAPPITRLSETMRDLQRDRQIVGVASQRLRWLDRDAGPVGASSRGCSSFPRSGSAQVARAPGRALPRAGWEVDAWVAGPAGRADACAHLLRRS